MTSRDEDAVRALLTPEAVRQRCHEILTAAEAGALEYFEYHPDHLNTATALVIDEIRTNYPDGHVPFHSRWRHFEFGDRDLWAELASQCEAFDGAEITRRKIDLAVVSVLLDAGAGPDWTYADQATGLVYGRSEGLALASIRLVETGILSQHGGRDPIRVDADALQTLKPDDLAAVFQIRPDNPLVGVESRTALLNSLGAALRMKPEIFGEGDNCRPGHLYDYLLIKQEGGVLRAREILIALLEGLGMIWPEGEKLCDILLGDVGRHDRIIRDDITSGILPFHKLSQWMAYSLIEPLAEAGMNVVELDTLTGLAEYRNGGLFMDTNVLTLRDSEMLAVAHHPKSTLVVEWRGLTVALLDKVAAAVRAHTGDDAESLPLASVLQGGTWTAGRRIAKQHRADGSPPIILDSNGTIF